MNPTPRIAITMGDPAGVGPEVIAAAIESGQLTDATTGVTPLILGHSEILQRAFRLRGSSRMVVPILNIEQYLEGCVSSEQAGVYCMNCVDDETLRVQPGTVDARGGHAAYQAVAKAAELALAGSIDAMVTAPLNKEALHLAGHHWPGHTELLADLCGVSKVAMMLYLPPYDSADPTVATMPTRLRLGPLGLGVGHVTLHIGMRDALAQIQESRILDTCHLVNQVMHCFAASSRSNHKLQINNQEFSANSPAGNDAQVRIGVAALNPHAGENGLFGREELEVINVAVAAGRVAGLNLSEALPCDTLMVRAAAGEFDGIVAMYHDQGHIALKLLGMQRAVNIALGLPIIRTSVAHGTAFDRAWQGTADHRSLLHAVRVASQLVPLSRKP